MNIMMSDAEKNHTAVLLDETVRGLEVKSGGHYIDATLGFGSHAQSILNAADNTTVLGIERDPHVAKQAQLRLQPYGDRASVIVGSYERIGEITNPEVRYNGVVFDLGYSSWHIDHSGKGFSFQKNEPLDMRYNSAESIDSAADVINGKSEQELFQIFEEFGEEPRSRGVARAIIKARAQKPLRTTHDLVGVIGTVIKRAHGKSIHPATKVFQAIRIAVNDELGVLQRTLPQLLDVIEVGGRIAIISFHSLEDRMVKRFFNHFDTTDVWIVTKKPIIPTNGEIAINPRARSAKLRIAQRV